MPRPTTKEDLIEAAIFKFEDRDKNLRDVLVHLCEWHKMVETWHRVGTVEGGIPAVPGKGYTWKTLPGLNVEIWKKYQDTSLSSSKQMLKESHTMILNLIEKHSDGELFSKGIYKWTKSSTLGAYFVSSTSSHYDWAMKKIKNHIKTYKTI